MVDKIGWTEPLDSERGALEIVMVPSCRRALLDAAVDGLRERMGIVTGARKLVSGRNHYDRCTFEGQQRWPARVRPRRETGRTKGSTLYLYSIPTASRPIFRFRKEYADFARSTPC